MCGIAGKVSFDQSVVDPRVIHCMCETLLHRGPDAEGIHVGPGIGLGQRRLSVIDLSEAAVPPLANDDGSLWIVFNGEIYNYRELRAELTAQGHRFRTESDTEVLLRVFELEGARCLARLQGMFAFAIWNTRTRTLFAARDRLGKKPFVYTRTSNAFLFGSAIKAIMASSEISSEPNFGAIDSYLTWQYVPSPLTAFKGVFKLPPGHFLTCDSDGDVRIQRYWSPPIAEKTGLPVHEVEHEIVRLLRESVRARMVADVSIGALLSGGIDSGAVVAMMAQESARPIKTFSIGFEEEEYNELPYARLVAERYGTDHQEFMVKPSAIEVLPELVDHYNEPFADSSAIPTWYVSRMTRQHVTVALTGDGGDESFAGYTRYADMLAWSRFDAVPAGVRGALRCHAQRVIDPHRYSNMRARLRRGMEMILAPLPQRYELTISILKPEEKAALYTAEFKALIGNTTEIATVVPLEQSDDPLSWMMRHDQSRYLPDCLMVKSDVASMAHGLELRSPFLDHRLVEFAATIPSALKLRDGQGKLILRRAVKDLLPPEVLGKRKTGFGVPLAEWLRGELAPLLGELLLDDRCTARNLFQRAFLHRMVDEHLHGRRDWSNRLWALLFLESWFRQCID